MNQTRPTVQTPGPQLVLYQYDTRKPLKLRLFRLLMRGRKP
jgi:hypothetical protein